MNLKQKKADLEKEEIKKAVDTSNTQGECAEKLGVSRMTLYRKMVRYGLGTFNENKAMKTQVENKCEN